MLTELSLASHAVPPAAAAAFAAALASNGTLRSLDLGDSTFGDEVRGGGSRGFASCVTDMCPATRCAEHLRRSSCRLTTSCPPPLQGLAALAPGIAASASLRSLNLEGKGITAAGCAALADALAARNSSDGEPRSKAGLEALQLGHNSLGGEGLAALLGGLGSASRLQSLDLNSCGLQGAPGVQPLAAALQAGRLPRLASLRLDGNALGAGGAAVLAAALGSPECALQQLHLHSCGLDGEAAAQLAAALPPNLAELDLSGNSVGSSGAAALAQQLAADAAPHLRRLVLCGCGLDGDAVAALAGALPGRPPLALDLGGNAAGGAAVVAALAAAPLSSLRLHDCQLGAEGAAALAGQLAATAAFNQLEDLDLSANRLEAPQLLQLLGALADAPEGAAYFLRTLVIAANPGASEDEVSAAVERLQAARPGLDVVRRAADTGEGGLMGR